MLRALVFDVALLLRSLFLTLASLGSQSGIYESIPACVPERVDYYNVFKPICPNAFWYRESRKVHLYISMLTLADPPDHHSPRSARWTPAS